MKTKAAVRRPRAKTLPLSRLETRLANALWRTWAMLPAGLAEISTEVEDDEEARRIVNAAHESAMRALDAAGFRGWKPPRGGDL